MLVLMNKLKITKGQGEKDTRGGRKSAHGEGVCQKETKTESTEHSRLAE